MFVVFNFHCSKCKKVEERFVKRSDMDRQACEACSAPMTRLPAATRTHFKFADTKLKR